MAGLDCPYMTLEEVLDKFPTEKCSGCQLFNFNDGVGECKVYALAVNVQVEGGK